jgi:hypothetical protein
VSDTVFILGAGASKAGGAPLMLEFLDIARAVAREGGDRLPEREQFERVFIGIRELGSVYEKSRLDSDNLEAVFAAFEMAKLFRRLGRLSERDIDALPAAMRALIVHTLEATLEFPVRPETAVLYAPYPYDSFVNFFRQGSGYESDVAVITFNYDLGVDVALHRAGLEVDYCLQPKAVPGHFPLMKLHGSLNWVECGQCGVAVYRLSDFFGRHPEHELAATAKVGSRGPTVHLRLADPLMSDKFEHCNGALRTPTEYVLVPPTWNKAEYHQRIAHVWEHAARHLSEARQVAVVGYSLPESDHFFRLLWALGTVGPARLEKFVVCDPEITEGSPLDERYRSLLGEVALKRYKRLTANFGTFAGDEVGKLLPKRRL